MRVLLVLALSLAAACGGPAARDVVRPGSLSDPSGAPSVERVTDLGDLPFVPASGALDTSRGDGVFAIGELVLVEGDSFGKLPTVSIGGHPVPSLARTGSGGIVCRIPPEIAAGENDVVVSHGGGHGQRSISVVRYGLAVEPGGSRLFVLSVGRTGELDGRGELLVPGAYKVAFSPDGQAAYVAIDPKPGALAELAVISMTAPGGPRLLRQKTLESARAERLAVAADGPVAAVWGGGQLTLVDIGAPLSPELEPAIPLAGNVTAMAFRPDGKLLAALSGDDNRLVPIDLASLDQPVIGSPLALLPGDRVPLVRDIAFAPGGDEAWVLSGASGDATPAGRQPSRITVVTWTGASPSLGRSETLDLATAPRHMALSRREATLSATSVRSTARRAVAVLSAVSQDGGGGATVAGVSGELARFDLDGATESIGEPARVGEVSLTPAADAALAVAFTPTTTPGTAHFGIAAVPLGGGVASYLELADVAVERARIDSGLAVAP